MLQALVQAKMRASCTLGEEAWTSLIGFHGNMEVSGFKGREQVSVEVAVREPKRLLFLTGKLHCYRWRRQCGGGHHCGRRHVALSVRRGMAGRSPGAIHVRWFRRHFAWQQW